MSIRKILTFILSTALILVCFTGCGKTERTDLNVCWGVNLAQAAEGYGVSAADAVVQQDDGVFNSTVFAEFEQAEVLGVPCKLKMNFTGYADHEPLLSDVYFYFDNQKDFEKLYDKLTALDGYAEIGESKGFYGVSALSKEDIAWLEQYTAIGAGKQGIAFAEIRLQDGKTCKTGTYGEETTLVQLSQSSRAEESVYFIRMTDSVFHILAQKDAYQQTYPDGIPTLEE